MSDFVSLLLIAAFLFVLPYACFRAAAARNRSRRWWRVPIIGVVATTLLYLVTILTQPVLDWRRDVAAFWAEGGPPPMLGTPGVIDPDAADGRGAELLQGARGVG